MATLKPNILITFSLIVAAGVYFWFPASTGPNMIVPPEVNGTVSKIVLANISGSSELDSHAWRDLSWHTIQFNKHEQIYVISGNGRTIDKLDENGELIKRIQIKLSDSDAGISSISLAPDGTRLMAGLNRRMLIDDDGNVSPVDGNVSQYDLDYSGCMYRDGGLYGHYYDDQLNTIPLPVERLSNAGTDGQYIYSDGASIIKYRSAGYPLFIKLRSIFRSALGMNSDSVGFAQHDWLRHLDWPVWKKPGAFSYYEIGFDRVGNYYTVLRDNGQIFVARINVTGQIDGLIKFPHGDLMPEFLGGMSDEEAVDYDMPKSQLWWHHLACDGTLYLYYNMPNFSEPALERWAAHGQVFMYKFEFDQADDV